ncbi:MAG TPA: HD domain-containing protein [Candidatus Sulfopaludibacter sp.]|jgi:[protein-PII] uridylyltransferase|nr:HD domain-containing protein [Candidatus Sulfopaludibacter sp.]
MTTVGNRLSKLSPVEQNFLESGDALTALAERTAEVDRCVLQAASELLFPAAPTDLALLAVGGYGRRQLFPYSDVDLLLLFSSERVAQERKEAISAFLQRLWDSGLRVSQSVRTPAECTEVHEQNTELNISLLDQRYLGGNRTLYAGMAEKLPRFLHASRDDLIRNLARLTRERYSKFGNTFYHLEPNVKETPGGLRDFQLVCWLEQLRDGASDPPPELKMAFRFMARLRCYLHCLYARDANILSFEAQDAISEKWQHADPARWMRDYYRHARTIHRAAARELENHEALSSSLFSQFRDWRSRVANQDFSVHRERAHFRAPQRIDVEPELVLRLFEFVARHGIRPSFEAEQRMESRVTRLRGQFAECPGLAALLLEIFSLPYAPLAARCMQETGVLAALFPELNQIECLVIRDFYHRYTVDEHTLVTMQNLWGLRGTEEAPQKFYGDLLAEVKQPGLLLLALLFHDVGKGADPIPEQGHAQASVDTAQAALARIHMPQQDVDTVLFLIRRHLELSGAMQSRDVFDPQTILDVAHRVETVERLKALTLVTYADISAVNPTAMTPWRAEQLWQLYLMVYNELTRELQAERIETLPTGSPERIAFLEGFPTRYLRTHGETEIAEHMALEEKSRKRGVGLDLRRLESAWQLTLVAGDHPGLFASAAGTLSSFGMNILKAEAFANRRGLVLDTFTFADPMRTLDLNPTEVDRLRSVAEKAVAGKLDVRELLKNRPKPVLPSRKARIPARVNMNSDASTAATLIEIVAEDRPGLLYDLASAISASGANIEVVLIDTEAHKAIDVFYVTAGGRKLEAEKQEALAEALRTVIG